jgi:predicted permease
LRALAVEPALGRIFTDQEESDQARVAVLGHGLWQGRYGSDPKILGRRLVINGEAHTVLGVMPKGFLSPRPWSTDSGAALWLPLNQKLEEGSRRNHWLFALGRLREGVSPAAAERELQSIAAALAEQYPETNSRTGAWIKPLLDNMVGDHRAPVWFLLAAVGFLLLISCANVASMLLARSTARRSEMAIRVSLGAPRGRLVRQLLTESLLLSLIGGAIGVLLGLWGVSVLRDLLPATVERLDSVTIDGWVLLFALSITLISGIVFGMAPVLSGLRLNPAVALRSGERTLSLGRPQLRLQGALVVVQVALALVLTHGAVLMLQSYLRVLGLPLTLDAGRTLTAGISLRGPKYESSTAQETFWNQLLQQVEAIPGVDGAAVTSKLPFDGGHNSSFLVGSETFDPDVDRRLVEFSAVTTEHDYFAAMGIPLISGRRFTQADEGESELGVIVNLAFAEHYWPQESALGKLVLPNSARPAWSATIVGVVDNVPQWGVEKPALPEIYFPQNDFRSGFLVVGAGVPLLTLIPHIRETVASIDPEIPVSDTRTMTEVRRSFSNRRRSLTALVILFTLVALVMVAVGIYGLMSYQVARRRQEIAIKLSLGAQRSRLLGAITLQGLRLSALGVVIGCVASLALSRVLSSLLFEVRPTDPLALFGAGLALAMIALLGSAIPAHRAAQLDPASILRCDASASTNS